MKGRHLDAKMTGDFFTQLGDPEPEINLEVGSDRQAELWDGRAGDRTAANFERLLG